MFLAFQVLLETAFDTEGKKSNVFLFGPTNWAKSFLLEPMEDMFKCFMKPADGKYPWVGLDECGVTVLQDFRWHTDGIATIFPGIKRCYY